MTFHTIRPLLLATSEGEKGAMTYLVNYGVPIIRPYVMWFIRAADENVLVDTAIEAQDYQNYHPGFVKFTFEAVQTFEDALATVDCTPNDIDVVIQTHLHVDHMYNTHKCRNATVYAQEKELEFALKPHPIAEIFYPKEMIENLDITTVNGNQEILPGILVMFTPGHTPGGQTVLVDTHRGRAAITGFCCTMENFTPPVDARTKICPAATYPVITPGIHTNPMDAYESTKKVKEIADIVIPVHDIDFARMEKIPNP